MLSSAAIVWGVQGQSHMLPVALATTPSNTPTPLNTASSPKARPASRNPIRWDDFLCDMKQYSDFRAQEGIVIAIYAIMNTLEDTDIHQVM